MSIRKTILGKKNSKNVVLIFNLTSAEVILQIQSEIRWAHSSILVSFLCQSSLSQWEFLNIFYIFVILRYDIYIVVLGTKPSLNSSLMPIKIKFWIFPLSISCWTATWDLQFNWLRTESRGSSTERVHSVFLHILKFIWAGRFKFLVLLA